MEKWPFLGGWQGPSRGNTITKGSGPSLFSLCSFKFFKHNKSNDVHVQQKQYILLTILKKDEKFIYIIKVNIKDDICTSLFTTQSILNAHFCNIIRFELLLGIKNIFRNNSTKNESYKYWKPYSLFPLTQHSLFKNEFKNSSLKKMYHRIFKTCNIY